VLGTRAENMPTTDVLQHSSAILDDGDRQEVAPLASGIIRTRYNLHNRKRRFDLLGLAGFFVGVVGLCFAVVSEFHLNDARSELRASREAQKQSDQTIARLVDELRTARADALSYNIEQLQPLIQQLGEQITAQQEFVKRVSGDYTQFASLVERHLVSLNELTVRQQAWAQAVARLQDLKNSQLRLQALLKDAQDQLSTSVHTSGDEIDTSQNKISKLMSAPGQNRITH
jgi:Mg2+ and Co2+ transporter CorA